MLVRAENRGAGGPAWDPENGCLLRRGQCAARAAACKGHADQGLGPQATSGLDLHIKVGVYSNKVAKKTGIQP